MISQCISGYSNLPAHSKTSQAAQNFQRDVIFIADEPELKPPQPTAINPEFDSTSGAA